MALDDLLTLADETENNEALQQFSSLFEQVMSIPDDNLNEENVDLVSGMINGAFTESMRKRSIEAMIEGFEESHTNKAEAAESIQQLKNAITDLIENELKPTPLKRKILDSVLSNIFEIFNAAVEQYHSFAITLPIMLDEGAVLPTYAHETDAAADLYAKDTVTVPAHTLGMRIPTGVHIGLPEGWAAYVVPRSSTGMKTPLRQSNCFGVIDSEYRGDVSLLFDNISDTDYEIKKGDRVAQMFIMPVYRFKPQQVETLDQTERGEGGFGSTGK